VKSRQIQRDAKLDCAPIRGTRPKASHLQPVAAANRRGMALANAASSPLGGHTTAQATSNSNTSRVALTGQSLNQVVIRTASDGHSHTQVTLALLLNSMSYIGQHKQHDNAEPQLQLRKKRRSVAQNPSPGLCVSCTMPDNCQRQLVDNRFTNSATSYSWHQYSDLMNHER
jgi:hypothetical protein